MKKWLNYLPTIFIISIIVSLIAYSSQGSLRHMNYSEFQNLAKTAEFGNSSLTISSNVIDVEGSIPIQVNPAKIQQLLAYWFLTRKKT